MRTKKYKINTIHGIVKVKGEAVVVPGFEDVGLFVHNPVDNKVGITIPDIWNVSEVITGRSIVAELSSKEVAISEAAHKLKYMGKDTIKQGIEMYPMEAENGK